MSTSTSSLFEPLEVIGRGLFGTVRKVRRKSDGAIFVRKEIDYNLMNQAERQQIIAEFRILRELTHPNIVAYYTSDLLPDQRMLHLYMEYCAGGDMAQLILTFKEDGLSFPERFVWMVLVQMLLALYRCHYGIDAPACDLSGSRQRLPARLGSRKVIHRDIKPDNIFLSGDNEVVKLGDFGLAKMLTGADMAKTYVGTPYYMLPEVLRDEPYEPTCDIWLLGCVLYEMCALQLPFKAKTHIQLHEKIREGKVAELPKHYSKELTSLIMWCLTVDPDRRPLTAELLDSALVRFNRKEMELKELETRLILREMKLQHAESEVRKAELRVGKAHLEHGAREAEVAAREAKLVRMEQAVEAKRQELAARERKMKELSTENTSEITLWVEEKLAAYQHDCAVQLREKEEQCSARLERMRQQMVAESADDRIQYRAEFDRALDQGVREQVMLLLLSKERLREYLQKTNLGGMLQHGLHPTTPLPARTARPPLVHRAQTAPNYTQPPPQPMRKTSRLQTLPPQAATAYTHTPERGSQTPTHAYPTPLLLGISKRTLTAPRLKGPRLMDPAQLLVSQCRRSVLGSRDEPALGTSTLSNVVYTGPGGLPGVA